MSITTNSNQSSAPHIYRYLTLTAFTPEDEPVAATTWFAAMNGKLYIRQPASAAVIGAVRQNGRVSVLPVNRSGESRGLSVVGRARIVPQFETYDAEHAIDHKYGVVAGMSHLMSDNQGLGGEVILEITLDPGPGTDELLVESLPETGQPAISTRAVIIGAALLGVASALTLLVVRQVRG